jgi:putative mRNA 3-end processing factor
VAQLASKALIAVVMSATPVDRWLYPTDQGLYCEPGQFFIDPHRPVDRALITHGHSDHARPGHGAVLATAETIAIMKVRYGENCAGAFEAVALREPRQINSIAVSFVPAGHILGSAQIVIENGGKRAVVSGDYKRAHDPTCAPFECVPCDVFVTEATFALPVFRHEPADQEVQKLLASQRAEPERTHLVGAYGLGKCQRIIKLLREAGYNAPIYLHGAMVSLCKLYQDLGIDLGELRPAAGTTTAETKGAIVLCPPSAIGDRWSRRFNDPVSAFASGWMRIRGRARQRGVELPLIISDHVDWPDLIDTIIETNAEETWVTHGRDDALVHHLASLGRKARALALVGRDDEAE